jgi:nucleotide-binding universal stress UspA family protein
MTAPKRIVVGLDGSDGSRSALHWAFTEAAVWDAELDVLHAWDLPFAFVPPLTNLAYDADVAAVERAAAALLDAEVAAVRPARDVQGADLLVVGSRGRLADTRR